jgi:hypothetical protein
MTDDQLIFRAKLWTFVGFGLIAAEAVLFIVTRRVDLVLAAVFFVAACCRLRASQLVRRIKSTKVK